MMTSLILSITSPQKDSMGSQATKTFDSTGGTIGRASRNDWVLPEGTVSSQHALISFQDNDFLITDLSTNGVYIDNSEVPLGTGNTAPLSGTRTLSIGLYLIAVEIQTTQESPEIATSSSENFCPDSPPVNDNSFLSDSTNDPLDLLGSNAPQDPFSSAANLPEDLFGESQSHSPLDLNQQNFENASSPSVADAFIPPKTHIEPSVSSSAIPDNWDQTSFSPAIQPPAPNVEEEKLSTPTDETGSLPSGETNAITQEESDIASQQTLITPAVSEPELKPTRHKLKPSPESNVNDKPKQHTSPQLKENTKPQVENENNYQSGPLTRAREAFQNNGLDVTLLDDHDLIDQSLALLPYMLEGILATLRSRSEVKNELRASQTILQPVENNPLKFSINLQDAFQNLLTNQRPGFLSPQDSVKQAFQDLTQHEAALIMGIQTGLNAMLEKISPNAIESKIENLDTKKNLFGKITAAKKWEYYKETYQHITENSSNSFIDMFGDDFVKGYEAYISNNKHYGR